ncbi:sigma-E processing peptidase SpoIIGA [Neobacillus cucumis]|uniref:sigma-E processing peptidase SpoIIGA n=1 Tax=Neobacillus cucumis TaxID=1740721 RepID=UPI0018DFD2B3|nr:sigma-E processing peptidase SpoIIGA [Neobacillus cucumis]MBI0578409.1 sigma-E processing peptidase SpoIIGA [Neobacillus cucumis]
MIVYLDVIWALNLLFDTLLLYLTAIFLKRKVRLWRLLSGGFIGSLIILLSFTPIHAFSNHPITKLLFSVLMILATFGYKRLVFFIKALMTLYVSTFLIGGALIGAHYFLQTESILLAGLKGFGDPISWLFVFIGFPIAWHFSKKNVEGMEMTKIQFDQIVSVNLTINSEAYTFKGLVDSGNQVYDPLTRLPVMFISIKNQMEIMSEPIKRMAANTETLLMGEEELPSEWQNKLRIIPFRVVGQEHQLIMAVKPDSILIEKNGDCFLCEKGLVSFTMQELSPDDAFQCIVHPKMLTGPRQPGNTEKVS